MCATHLKPILLKSHILNVWGCSSGPHLTLCEKGKGFIGYRYRLGSRVGWHSTTGYSKGLSAQAHLFHCYSKWPASILSINKYSKLPELSLKLHPPKSMTSCEELTNTQSNSVIFCFGLFVFLSASHTEIEKNMRQNRPRLLRVLAMLSFTSFFMFILFSEKN